MRRIPPGNHHNSLGKHAEAGYPKSTDGLWSRIPYFRQAADAGGTDLQFFLFDKPDLNSRAAGRALEFTFSEVITERHAL